MRRSLGWIPVALLVGLLAVFGHHQLHQRHINLFLLAGCLATFVVMLSFFWIARDRRERGKTVRGQDALAIDRDDQNF